jgi:NAD(P)-dependent dehydrogenase (short-subunit alcohol dehydrogenase family)
VGVEGRTALVTGASAGIGAALAVGLAEHGATVGICARREDRLADVLAQCQAHQPDSRMWAVDLADLDGVAAFAERADDELGGIDLLVNNAGMPKRRTVADLTIEEVDGVMALNYLSPVRLTKALLPRMLDRGKGQIVNLSSVAARLAPPGEAAYAASKAALTAFSECLAVEIWNTPVSVHVVDPGVIDTELFGLPGNDPLLAPIEAEPPQIVVDAVLDQLESGRFEVYVPAYFEDFATGKAANLEEFLAGSAEWYRSARGLRGPNGVSMEAG